MSALLPEGMSQPFSPPTTSSGIPEMYITKAIGEVMRTSPSRLEEMAARGRESVRAQHYTPTETAKLIEHVRESVTREARE